MSGRLRDKFLIGAIVGVVVGVGAVAGSVLRRRPRTDATLAERAEDRRRRFHALCELSSRIAIAPRRSRDTLLRQVNIIRSLDEDRYVWPHVIDEISRALPQYTWLTVARRSPARRRAATTSSLAPQDAGRHVGRREEKAAAEAPRHR